MRRTLLAAVRVGAHAVRRVGITIARAREIRHLAIVEDHPELLPSGRDDDLVILGEIVLVVVLEPQFDRIDVARRDRAPLAVEPAEIAVALRRSYRDMRRARPIGISGRVMS
jgi:hypothetical protein